MNPTKSIVILSIMILSVLLFSSLVSAAFGDGISNNSLGILINNNQDVAIAFDFDNNRWIGFEGDSGTPHRIIDYGSDLVFNLVLFNVSDFMNLSVSGTDGFITILDDTLYLTHFSINHMMLFNMTTGAFIANATDEDATSEPQGLTNNGTHIFETHSGRFNVFDKDGIFIEDACFLDGALGTEFFNGTFYTGNFSDERIFTFDVPSCIITPFVSETGQGVIKHLARDNTGFVITNDAPHFSRFDFDGTRSTPLTTNVKGSGAGSQRPRGIAFDGTNFFVIDDQNIMFKYDTSFNLLDSFFTGRQATRPRSLGFVDGKLYVFDVRLDNDVRIMIYDTNGLYLSNFSTSPILNTATLFPRGVTSDDDFLYLGMEASNEPAIISKFTLNGTYLQENITIENPFIDKFAIGVGMEKFDDGFLIIYGDDLFPATHALMGVVNNSGAFDPTRLINFSDIPLNSSFPYGIIARPSVNQIIVVDRFDVPDFNNVNNVIIFEGFFGVAAPPLITGAVAFEDFSGESLMKTVLTVGLLFLVVGLVMGIIKGGKK